MTTTIFDRTRKSGKATATGSGADPAAFDASGLAEVASADEFLAQFGGLELVGTPLYRVHLDVAGNATTTITVPTGKTWRLLTATMEITADANAANRIVHVLTRDTADTTIEDLTMPTATANDVDRIQVVFEDKTKGNLRVEPVGTLTMDTVPVATKTITINGEVMTWIAALTGPGQLLIGANVAAAVTALEAALVDRDNGGVLHSVSDASFAAMEISAIDFAADDMVVTYAGPGNATVDGEALATTTTMAAGANAWGAATLGDTTAGIDAGTVPGTSTFPTTLLLAGEDILFSVTNGLAGDDLDVYLTVIEYDETIT